MSSDCPNHLKLQRGEIVAGVDFGEVCSVNPIHFAGPGHHPKIEARFSGGLRLDFCPHTFIELLRAGQEALAKLPHWPDISGSVGGWE